MITCMNQDPSTEGNPFNHITVVVGHWLELEFKHFNIWTENMITAQRNVKDSYNITTVRRGP